MCYLSHVTHTVHEFNMLMQQKTEVPPTHLQQLLPVSLRHAAAACMQVISEYRKARDIMAHVADEGATEGVWHNLFLEVDKVTPSVVSHHLLANTLPRRCA